MTTALAYRYELHRRLGTLPAGPSDDLTICWVMLNPSTADDEHDDPTVRRVIDYSTRWGYDRVVVVNLFAMRATDPALLRAAAHVNLAAAVGPDNDTYIREWTIRADRVMAAWGACGPGPVRARADHVWQTCMTGMEVWCLGRTRGDEPRHPLYVPRNVEPVPYMRHLYMEVGK